MNRGRLEAFSDGVIAIIITIMVLELKTPHETGWSALAPLAPVFLCYVLSFLTVGIYWSNHHHLLQACQKVDGRILLANLHLLFWLTLIPFTTAWMGENHFAPLPVAMYGVVLFCAGCAYYVLTHTLIATHGRNSVIAKAVGSDHKGRISVIIYAVAIAMAWAHPLVSFGTYVSLALFWLVPDRRIEKMFMDAAGDK